MCIVYIIYCTRHAYTECSNIEADLAQHVLMSAFGYNQHALI